MDRSISVECRRPIIAIAFGAYYPTFSSPVVTGQTVWVAYEYTLTALSLSDGKKLYEFRFDDADDNDGPADGPPIVVYRGRIYYCTRHALCWLEGFSS